MKIADLPACSKPREKALKNGLSSCSESELLAMIIGNGVPGHSALEIANDLLFNFNGLSSISEASLNELERFDGISKIKALMITTVFEISKRFSVEEENKQPQSVYSLFLHYSFLKNESQEMLYVVCLDKRKRIKKERLLYKGTGSRLAISSKEIIAEALKSGTNTFAIIHNHPSGESLPSKEDIKTTLEILEKSKNMGLDLFDHIIIGKFSYHSFLEEGLLSAMTLEANMSK